MQTLAARYVQTSRCLVVALCVIAPACIAQPATPVATPSPLTLWELVEQVEQAIPFDLSSLESALKVKLVPKQPHWTAPDVVTFAAENLQLADGKRVTVEWGKSKQGSSHVPRSGVEITIHAVKSEIPDYRSPMPPCLSEAELTAHFGATLLARPDPEPDIRWSYRDRPWGTMTVGIYPPSACVMFFYFDTLNAP